MALVEPLIEIAKANGCADLELRAETSFKLLLKNNTPSFTRHLESRLVDETGFLKGVSRWLEIPWWSEPITGVPGPLREKVPAKTALRYHVVPLQEDEHGI